jgi:hypothetical protein
MELSDPAGNLALPLTEAAARTAAVRRSGIWACGYEVDGKYFTGYVRPKWKENDPDRLWHGGWLKPAMAQHKGPICGCGCLQDVELGDHDQEFQDTTVWKKRIWASGKDLDGRELEGWVYPPKIGGFWYEGWLRTVGGGGTGGGIGEGSASSTIVAIEDLGGDRPMEDGPTAAAAMASDPDQPRWASAFDESDEELRIPETATPGAGTMESAPPVDMDEDAGSYAAVIDEPPFRRYGPY